MNGQRLANRGVLRPEIHALAGYIPGEQPSDSGIIKLNTNENPYPPSPRVRETIQALLDGDRLRKYPDPCGTAFRETAGRVFGVDPACILIGNGSDDILTIVLRACVPEGGLVVSLTPSYLLYKTLCDLQGARFQAVPFAAGWLLPDPWPIPDANLTLIANPNSPSGTQISTAALERLASRLAGLLVIDEAYVDFADNNALRLAEKPNVIVTRSLSKSYSLAGLRFGFGVGHRGLIEQLYKVKDSYNCDSLSLAGASAALEDQDYMKRNRERIVCTRSRLSGALRSLGFSVPPSNANFVWAVHDDKRVKPMFEALKRRQILVRYMDYGEFGDGLRISIGTDEDVDRLLDELRTMV